MSFNFNTVNQMFRINVKPAVAVAVAAFLGMTAAFWPSLVRAQDGGSEAVPPVASQETFNDASTAAVTGSVATGAVVPDLVAASVAATLDLDTATAHSILDAVKLARQKLEQERLKRLALWHGQPPVYKGDYPSKVEVVLAVWNRASGTVNLYLADKQGEKMWMKSPGSPPIAVSSHARLYSRYKIPPNCQSTVVGVLYPVMESIGTKKKPLYRTQETVYVPPTAEMFVPQMLTAGSDYLSYLIRDAFDELQRRQIRSRAFPDRSLAEAIDPYLVKSVVVIEHSAHQVLLREDDPESALGSFYVNLAANGEAAFSDAESTAGALGLAQFIPSTYALFVKNRPDLGLIPDFRQGMADHRNAVIAEVAYFDDTLRALPADVRADYLRDPAQAAAFLAAAYNGGVDRVKKAITTYGDDWDDYHGATKKTRAKSLRQETVTYVAKLRKVYAMLTAGVFATPSAPSNALPTGSAIAAITDGTAGGSPSAVPPVDAAKKLAVIDPLTTICFDDGGCSKIE